MRRWITLSLLAMVTVAAFPGALRAQPQRPMTIVDVLSVPRVSDPQLSPDDSQLLYTVTVADWKANRAIPHVWRANLDGTGAVQMTNGTEGESGARWSPDGRMIAFIAKRTGAESAQVHLLSNTGGEARALTEHPTAVASLAWAPDGSAIYFLAEDAKTDAEKEKDKAKDDVYALDENFKQRHLWKVSVADKKATRITEGDFSVLDYRLSRDGKRIAHHRAPSPLYGDAERGEVWIMAADGSAALQLTKNSVPESWASLSPDGSTVIFGTQANAAFETYYNRKIFAVPVGGGQARVLTGDLPYEVDAANWGPDGSIYFVANMGVHSELFHMPAKGGKPAQITSGTHAFVGWNLNPVTGRHAVQLTDRTSPGEIWVTDCDPSAGEKPVQVTRVFDYLARDFKLPRQERVEWKGADGVTVEGILTYPLDYVEGRRYALAVHTHGGPQASDKFGIGTSWGTYLPVMAAKGYAVLQPNYRGSTGYGDAFLRDMVGSYFKNSHLDVMTGVDHVVKLGIADPDRMVKLGWSGGGHMTNKIVTFTDRFKAAASGAGASNWISMYGQSDVRTYRTPWFGGTPWQPKAPTDLYWEHSPLKYVANVKTPTIFLVGEQDVRVPPPQAVEMYRALKANGVPTHLYLAPREPHGWQELRHQLYKVNVELAWFEKWANNRDYSWETAPK